MKKIILFILFTVISCTPAEKKVLSVGKFEITDRDIQLREKIIKVFYPNSDTKDAGLIQLKQAFTIAAVMEQNGFIINDHKLKNETDRIDASTKDPKTLNRIKQIFKGQNGKFDQEKYKKVFILPTYVERLISTSFFQELPIHQETHKKALDLHMKVKENSKILFDLALENKWKHGEWCISKKDGVSFTDSKEKKSKQKFEGSKLIDKSNVPNAEIKNQIESEWAQQNTDWIERWFAEIINPTQVGKIVDSVIDYSESWMIMRLNSKNSVKACMDTVVIEKIAFDKWFEAEKAKVTIKKI